MESAEKNDTGSRLKTIREVPVYLQFNRYIKYGYRPSPQTPRDAFFSIFSYWHNESFNILIHLLSAVLFLYWWWYPPVPYLLYENDTESLRAPVGRNSGGGSGGGAPHPSASLPGQRHRFSEAPPADAAFILSFISGLLAFTFILSVTYHTFMSACRTQIQYSRLLQCDVSGVLCSIVGSVTAFFYRGNKCLSPGFASVATGSYGVTALWSDPEYRYSCLFVLVVVSSIAVVYVLFLAPHLVFLRQFARRGALVVWDGTVVAVGRVLECIFAPGETEIAVPSTPVGLRGRRTSGEERRRPPRQKGFCPPPPQSNNILLTQYFVSKKRLKDWWNGSESAAKKEKTAAVASGTISPARRGLIFVVFILTHILCYCGIIYPKRSEHGYHHSVYYHGVSYILLFIGGVLNGTRMPEALLHRGWKQRRRERRQWAEEDGTHQSQWRVYRETNPTALGDPIDRLPLNSPEYWKCALSRATPCTCMTHFLLSPKEMAFCFHSHGLWHLCSTLCSITTVLAVYYDCVEWELMTCDGR